MTHFRVFPAAVLAVAIFSAGCMMVPARYKSPIQPHGAKAPRTLAIEGFNIGSFQPTGYSTSSEVGSATAVGTGGHATASYVGSGLTVHNEYVVSSEAETFRTLLAQTNCVRVVGPGASADLVLVGQLSAAEDMSWHYAFQFFEGLTLLPLFGMPIPLRGSAIASANVYQKSNGELITTVNTGRIYLTAWSTLYSTREDGARGLGILREMAMRDLAERLASSMCGGRTASAH